MEINGYQSITTILSFPYFVDLTELVSNEWTAHKEHNGYCGVHSSVYFIAGAVPTTKYYKHYCQFNEIKVFMSVPFKFSRQIIQNVERSIRLLWSCLTACVQRMPNISMEFRLKPLLIYENDNFYVQPTHLYFFIWHFDTLKYDSEIVELRSSCWLCAQWLAN